MFFFEKQKQYDKEIAESLGLIKIDWWYVRETNVFFFLIDSIECHTHDTFRTKLTQINHIYRRPLRCSIECNPVMKNEANSMKFEYS